MTLAFTIALPSLASVTVWGLVVILTAYFAFHAGRLKEQRSNDAFVRKACRQMIDAPHIYAGPA